MPPSPTPTGRGWRFHAPFSAPDYNTPGAIDAAISKVEGKVWAPFKALGGAAFRGVKGGALPSMRGLARGAAGLGRFGLYGAARIGADVGSAGKFLLAGGQALMPNMARVGGWNDIQTKFALNPRIASRLIGGGLVASAVIGAMGALNTAQGPSVYFDGTEVRHVNDMGTGAAWARSMRRKR